METKLFDKLNGRMPVFNKPLLDIQEGKWHSGFPEGGITTFSVVPNRSMPNITFLTKMLNTVKSYAPNTHERWCSAYNFLRYLGYHVVWDDLALCPSVHWINTEGNADDEAAFIHDILHKDYTVE